MKTSAIGTIVAERRLYLDARGQVIVRIGKPRKYHGSTSYYCPYEITGLDGRHSQPRQGC